MGFLAGKRAVVVGLASNRSIGWGIARALKAQGAELAFNYQGDKLQGRVEKMAAELDSEIVLPLDVTEDSQIDSFIDGVAVTPSDYKDIGGIVPFRMFRGNLTVTGTTIERANGSDLGSFVEEGFLSGQAIRVIIDNGVTTETADGVITSLGELSMTVTWDVAGVTDGTWEAATISQLIKVGEWDGDVIFEEAVWESDASVRVYWITRADGTSWIADGFLEGQWVRTTGTNADEYKIAIIRGTNATKDDTLELTFRNPLADASLLTLGAATITVNRIAAAATLPSCTAWTVKSSPDTQSPPAQTRANEVRPCVSVLILRPSRARPPGVASRVWPMALKT